MIKFKCFFCKNDFEAGGKNRKYCSLRCAWNSKDRIRNNPDLFTEEMKKRIIEIYSSSPETGFLDNLSKELGKNKTSISAFAKRLNLTNRAHKRSQETLKKMSLGRLELQKRRPDLVLKWQEGRHNLIMQGKHPRGMLGKKHSNETRMKMSRAGKGRKKSPEHIKHIMETKIKNGTFLRHRTETSWKAGWETIDGRKFYFRSSWEKEYAHYLSFMKRIKEIEEWDYEPDTFWFDKIKRGVVSYTPDFKIFKKGDKIEYHEIKGWMDPRSITKIKRMKKYYPNVKLIVLRKKDLQDIGII